MCVIRVGQTLVKKSLRACAGCVVWCLLCVVVSIHQIHPEQIFSRGGQATKTTEIIRMKIIKFIKPIPYLNYHKYHCLRINGVILLFIYISVERWW